jgi:hypothetical protein
VGVISVQQFFGYEIEQRVGRRNVKQALGFSARKVFGAAPEQALTIRSQYRP